MLFQCWEEDVDISSDMDICSGKQRDQKGEYLGAVESQSIVREEQWFLNHDVLMCSKVEEKQSCSVT